MLITGAILIIVIYDGYDWDMDHNRRWVAGYDSIPPQSWSPAQRSTRDRLPNRMLSLARVAIKYNTQLRFI